MHTVKTRKKFENYFKVFILFALGVFALTLYYISSDLTYLTDGVITHHFHLDSPSESFMKTIQLTNNFDHEISVHYDDGETGLYLSNLDPGEKVTISASLGQGLYATDPNGWERLDFVSIRSDIKEYIFSPHEKNSLIFRQLNIGHQSRPHPLVVNLHFPVPALSTRFKSLSSRNLELWFNDGREGIQQGHLHMGQETTTCSYPGHRFFVVETGHKETHVVDFLITSDRVVYYIEDPDHPASDEVLSLAKKEQEFMAEYFNRTGIQWRHYFGPNGPRPPPMHFMWPAKAVGDVHRIYSSQGYWHCSEAREKCQSSESVKLELEVLSLKPRVFVIENFISDHEADHIVKLAQPRLHHSSVGDVEAGAFESDTRTSLNSWIPRDSTEIMDSLYRRAADLLQIDEKLLVRSGAVEDLQVVHYVDGQKYEAHHDWGVSGHEESRYITLLFYLTDQVNPNAGGETSFPKGGADGNGFKVRPKKGNAVLFYNLLEDGNADDLSLHAALPVTEGEKWLANFWVWDPKIR